VKEGIVMPKNSIVLFLITLVLLLAGVGFATGSIFQGGGILLLIGVIIFFVSIVTGIVAFFLALRYDDARNQGEKDAPKAH